MSRSTLLCAGFHTCSPHWRDLFATFGIWFFPLVLCISALLLSHGRQLHNHQREKPGTPFTQTTCFVLVPLGVVHCLGMLRVPRPHPPHGPLLRHTLWYQTQVAHTCPSPLLGARCVHMGRDAPHPRCITSPFLDPVTDNNFYAEYGVYMFHSAGD